jgi:hypothetical protein
MQRGWRSLGRICVVLAFLAAACGGTSDADLGADASGPDAEDLPAEDAADDPDDPGDADEPSSVEAMDEAPADDGNGGGSAADPSEEEAVVRGQVVMIGDTPDVPDAPAEDGVVVLVPAGARASFWELTGTGPEGPADPSTIRAALSPDDLPEATFATIGADGTFAADVDLAGGLLCVADIAAGDEAGPPHQLWGCTEVRAEDLAADLRVAFDRAVYLD